MYASPHAPTPRDSSRVENTQDALRRGVSQRPPCRFEVIEVDPAKWVAEDASPLSEGADVASGGDSADGGAGTGAEAEAGGGSSTTTSASDGAVTVVLDVAHNPPAIIRFFDKVCVVFYDTCVVTRLFYMDAFRFCFLCFCIRLAQSTCWLVILQE